MRMRRLRAGIAVGATIVTGVTLAMPGLAKADTAAQPSDVVVVGSDTIQNAADFLFDGSPFAAGGVNSGGNANRVYSYDATGDANGRAVYDGTCGTASTSTGLAPFCDSTTNKTPNALPGSVVLRAGTKPVVRPNGSGAGVGALIADAPASGQLAGGSGYDGLPLGSIQAARMSRLPKSTEEAACPINSTTLACGGLHVYQFATDNLAIAHVASGYDGPAAGLSIQQLYDIYNGTVPCAGGSTGCSSQTSGTPGTKPGSGPNGCLEWSDVPGASDTSNAVIHPLIPQPSSGTASFFEADLGASVGTTTFTPNSTCVRQVEEHDPTGIYGDPSPADAIEPFSTGKISLINNGYFSEGVGYMGSSEANGAYTPGYLSVSPTTVSSGDILGSDPTAGDGNPVYQSTRGLYFVVRQEDVTNTTPFQTGGTQNFVQALFTGSSSTSIQGNSGKAEIRAAGFAPAFKDCGINPTSC